MGPRQSSSSRSWVEAELKGTAAGEDLRAGNEHRSEGHSDRDSARTEYQRFIARLEARGSFDAAVLERAYARAAFAAPTPRPIALRAPARYRLTRDQSFALRRVAVAVVAIAATFGAMFIAGAQIFASGGPL